MRILRKLSTLFLNVGPTLAKDIPESEKSYNVEYMKHFGQNTFTFRDLSENDTLKLLCGLKEFFCANTITAEYYFGLFGVHRH